jgi:predicted CXXCH cytochrome family protein
MLRRKAVTVIASLAILSVIVVVALAQSLLPPKHPKINPTTDSTLCFSCHQSAELPTAEASGFCEACHFNAHYEFVPEVESLRLSPRPRHPVPPDWPTSHCFTCHEPHKAQAAKHPVVASQPKSSFCLPCHATPLPKEKTDAIYSGEERSGDFCMPCHNMGLTAQHPQIPEALEARFCFMCHKWGE